MASPLAACSDSNVKQPRRDLHCRPCERRDPYAAAAVWEMLSAGFFATTQIRGYGSLRSQGRPRFRLTQLRIPAARFAPELLHASPFKHEEGAGKAGCWPHPWPACKQKSRRQSPQVQPIIRPSPRNGFNGFLRALPGDRALLPPSPLRSLLLKNLTPASGRQDHPTSPSAKVPLVRATIAPGAPASIASRTHVS